MNWVREYQVHPTQISQWKGHPEISISRLCELIALPRSSYYYAPVGESDYNLALMRIIDEQYLRTPFFGSRQMARWLRNQGDPINRKRIQRLTRIMGLEGHGTGYRKRVLMGLVVVRVQDLLCIRLGEVHNPFPG